MYRILSGGCMYKILVGAVLLISLTSFADRNDTVAFYSGTEYLTGYALKTSIKKAISKNHVDRGYADLLDIYFESDIDREFDNDGSILDMYSENPYGKDTYTYKNRNQACGSYRQEADCFNREHIFPQSIFSKRSPMKSDFFQVFPTDGYVNNRRGSFPFGEVSNPEWTSSNGCKVGVNTFGNYRGTVFEPIDEFKGDIARALLYFATRYEDHIAGWHHDMLNGTRDQVYQDWFIQLLIKWHLQDPVSDHELHRNDIGQQYQGNRNPFIDHPEWVEEIWGN